METPKKFGEGLQLTPQEMAAQLRKPEGETGIKVRAKNACGWSEWQELQSQRTGESTFRGC